MVIKLLKFQPSLSYERDSESLTHSFPEVILNIIQKLTTLDLRTMPGTYLFSKTKGSRKDALKLLGGNVLQKPGNTTTTIAVVTTGRSQLGYSVSDTADTEFLKP